MAETSWVMTGTVSGDGTGSYQWTNPSNLTADDGSNMTISYTGDGPLSTEFLSCTNFGLSIPAGSVVDGVQFRLGDYTSGQPVTYFAPDSQPFILTNRTKYVRADQNDTPLSANDTTQTDEWGVATEDWGLGLTRDDIQHTDFGIKWDNLVVGTTTTTFQVDYLAAKVFYHAAIAGEIAGAPWPVEETGHSPVFKSAAGNYYKIVSHGNFGSANINAHRSCQMYKSSTPGGTGPWTRVSEYDFEGGDSQNGGAAMFFLNAVQDGDVIHTIALIQLNTNPSHEHWWRYASFNMATDTWSTTETVGIEIDSGAFPLKFVRADIGVRTDGDVIVAYTGDPDRVMGGEKHRVDYARRESGTWTTAQALDAAGDIHYGNPVLTMNGGAAHIIWGTTSNTADPPTAWTDTEARTLDNSNSLSTKVTSTENYGDTALNGAVNAINYDDSGTQRIIVALAEDTGSATEARILRATEDGSGNITGITGVSVDGTQEPLITADPDTGMPLFTGQGHIAVSLHGTDLYLVWVGGGSNGVNKDIYYNKSTDGGATWEGTSTSLETTTAEHVTAIVNDDLLCYTWFESVNNRQYYGDLSLASTVAAAGTITFSGDLAADGKSLSSATTTFSGTLAGIGARAGEAVGAIGIRGTLDARLKPVQKIWGSLRWPGNASTAEGFYLKNQNVSTTAVLDLNDEDGIFPEAGDLLVICQHNADSFPDAFPLPTDDGTGAWNYVGDSAVDGSGGQYRMFWKIAAGDEEVFTFNATSAGDILGIVYCFPGDWDTNPLDVKSFLEERDTTLGQQLDSGATATTAKADSLAMGIIGGEPANTAITLAKELTGGFGEDVYPTDLRADFTQLGSAHAFLDTTQTVRLQGTWSHVNQDHLAMVAVFSRSDTRRARAIATVIGDLAAIGTASVGVTTALGTITVTGDLVVGGGQQKAVGTTTFSGDLAGIGQSFVFAVGTITITGDLVATNVSMGRGTITALGDAISEGRHDAFAVTTFIGELIAGGGQQAALGTSTFAGDLTAAGVVRAFGTITATGDLVATATAKIFPTATSTFIGDLASDGKSLALGTSTFIGDLAGIGQSLGGLVSALGTISFTGDLVSRGTSMARGTITTLGTGLSQGIHLASGTITFSGDLVVGGGTQFLTAISTSTGDLVVGGGQHDALGTSTFTGDLAAIGTNIGGGLVNALGTITFSGDLAASGTHLASGTITAIGQVVAVVRAKATITASCEIRANTVQGVEGRDSYGLTTPATVAFAFGSVQSKTYEFLWRPPRLGGANNGILFTQGDTNPYIDIFLDWDSPNWRPALRLHDGTSPYTVYTDFFPDDETWRHVAFVVDRSNDELRSYINGELTGTTDITAMGGVLPSGDPAYLLHNPFDTPARYSAISEFRVWGIARTQQQIRDNAWLQLIGSETNLSVLLDLKGYAGEPVADLGSNIVEDLAGASDFVVDPTPPPLTSDNSLPQFVGPVLNPQRAKGTIRINQFGASVLVASGTALGPALGTITAAGDLAATGTSLARGTITALGVGLSEGRHNAVGTISLSGDLAAVGLDVFQYGSGVITALGTLIAGGGQLSAAGTSTFAGNLAAVGTSVTPTTDAAASISFIGKLEGAGIQFCPILASGTISLTGSVDAFEQPSDDVVIASAGAHLRTYANYDPRKPLRGVYSPDPAAGNSPWKKPGIFVGTREYFGPFVQLWESDGDPNAVMGGNDSEWVWREDGSEILPPFDQVFGDTAMDGHYFVRNQTKNSPPELVEYYYDGVYVTGEYYIDATGPDLKSNKEEWAEGDEWELLWRDFIPALRARGTIVSDGGNLLAYGSINVIGQLREAYLHKVSCINPTAMISMSGATLSAGFTDPNLFLKTATITFSGSLGANSTYSRASVIDVSASLSAIGRLTMEGSAPLVSQAASLSFLGQIGAGTIDGQKQAVINTPYGSIEVYNNSQGGYFTIGGGGALKEAFALITIAPSLDAIGQKDQTKFAIGAINVSGDLDTTSPITSVVAGISVVASGALGAVGEHTGVTATSTFSGDLVAVGEQVVTYHFALFRIWQNTVLSGTAESGIQVKGDGKVYRNTNGSYAEDTGNDDDYIQPHSAGATSGLKVRATKTAGSDPSVGTLDTWIAVTADPEWYQAAISTGFPDSDSRSGTIFLEFSIDEVEILASGNVNLLAQSGDIP